MEATALVQAFLEAFDDGKAMAVFADDFRLTGDGSGAPVLVFGVPGATAAELSARGMAITIDDLAEGPEGHVVVWGSWTENGDDPDVYHLVITVRNGMFAEARFFPEMEQARWYAGL